VLYTHIVDPRTGRPVENMLMTVAIAASNTASDALSTAFFVSGVEQTRAYLQNYPNLTAILFASNVPSEATEQVVLRSNTIALPADSFIWS
jgi:thiamine biosynthesis lipoprotein